MLVDRVYVPSGAASLFTDSSSTSILHERVSVGERLSGRGFAREQRTKLWVAEGIVGLDTTGA
jgi:hypothetical protein